MRGFERERARSVYALFIIRSEAKMRRGLTEPDTSRNSRMQAAALRDGESVMLL